MSDIFNDHESQIRSYCRRFPIVFKKARGSKMIAEDSSEFIDFFMGAGSLNYGHNPPEISSRLIAYLQEEGVIHSLDMFTGAKKEFIETFVSRVLKPRNMNYRLAFPNPTGTNAIELAIKFARKKTGRNTVVAFTNAYHGMTLGALSLTGNRSKREGAGCELNGVFRAPFDGYMGVGVDTSLYLEKLLNDPSSGLDQPAAIILETIQAEGGLNLASHAWLRRVATLAKNAGALLIIDDIQVGCGRSGQFFSFEESGIQPDIICLSKSIGGAGLPLSLVLVDEASDILEPGQHNGTFRGNNLAFVAGAAALEFWENDKFHLALKRNEAALRAGLEKIAKKFDFSEIELRGRGLLLGLAWRDKTIAGRVADEAFKNKVLIETCGSEDQVLKLMPALNISEEDLNEGLLRLESAIRRVLG